ncbi:YitT family protein [Acutalibacter caecimuris]|uniref:YitT family protein n=1 Tax=Acutalibacter caecimuris TaxID=3093657 RepID=UPI002AC99B9D|nr:YitT family protein [Acutalibacter sp. M00118]
MEIRKQLKELRGRNFVMLALAGIVNAVGVTLFIAPVQLYDSGISGTSILFSQLTPPHLSLSFFLLLLNLPLFLFGLKRQGLAFTVYACYAVLVYSLCAWLITDVLPVDVRLASPLAGTDLLLCALFGGMISGMGSGIAIRFGGAMDGIEVLAVTFAKRIGITVGTFVMLYNAILYILCGVVIGSWVLPLYSIVTYMAALKTVDFIVEGIDRSKAAMIITARQEEVCSTLSEAFGVGITIFPATGYYSGGTKACAYIILNRFQIGRMKELVHTCDPQAYITITEVADVFTNNSG